MQPPARTNACLGIEVLPWTLAELQRRLGPGEPFAREILKTEVAFAGEVPS